MISSFLVDRDFLGKLERYGLGNPKNYTHLTISNFLSEILDFKDFLLQFKIVSKFLENVLEALPGDAE